MLNLGLLHFWLIHSLICFHGGSTFRVITPLFEEAIEGDRFVLRCSYADEQPLDTVFVVLWQKLDSLGSATTVYNSQNSLDQKHHGGRLKQVGGASLEISPVLKSDAGKYRCQVTPLPSFEQGEALTELVVTYPPHFETPTNSTIYLDKNADVNLPCRATALPGDIVYIWYFHGNERDMESALNVHHDKRIWFVQGKSIHISDFSQSLEGLYRCQVTNQVGTRNSYFQLYLKRPAVFIDYPDQPVTVTEGNDVTMMVTTQAVPDNVTFKWVYKEQPIDLFGWSSVFGFDQSEVYPYLRIINSGMDSRLEIKDVTRKVAGVYACVISNDVGTPTRVNITLDVHYPATASYALTSLATTFEGGSVTLPCGGKGNPRPWFVWETPLLKTVSSIPDSRTSDRFSLSPSGNLTVDPVYRNDSGVFRCKTFNGIGDDQESTTNLTVQYAPVFLHRTRSRYVVKAGLNLTFDCSSTALPSPTYTWFKDRQPITAHNDSLTLGNSLTSLHLVNVTSHHRGIYRCQAENHLGMVFNEFQVRVQFAAVIHHLSEVRRVLVGDNINITCLVHGGPLPALEWSHAFRSSDVGIAGVIRNGTRGRTVVLTKDIDFSSRRSTLMLTRVGLQDCGFYYCSASNILGTDKGYTELRCIDLPQTPQDVEILQVSSYDVTVKWRLEPHIPNGEQFYCSVAKVNDTGQPKVMAGDMTSCHVTSLNESTAYRLRVFGVNSAGKGNYAESKFSTNSNPHREKQSPSPTLPQTSPRPRSTTPTTTQATAARSTFAKLAPTMGVTDVTYNVTGGWVTWRIDASLENALTLWNSSLLRQCVKVEAKRENSSNWRLVAWCVAVWAEACRVRQPPSAQPWMVRVYLCWGFNTGCGKAITADTVGQLAGENSTPPTPQNDDEVADPQFPALAIAGALLAVTSVLIVYVITYVHLRNRRRNMGVYGRARERVNPSVRSRMLQDDTVGRQARAFQASIDCLRLGQLRPPAVARKSYSLPGHASRRWNAI